MGERRDAARRLFTFVVWIALLSMCSSQQVSTVVAAADLDPGAKCENYTGSACAAFFNSSTIIYTNSSLSQKQRETQIIAILAPFALASSGYANCTQRGAALACYSFFPPCEVVHNVALATEICSSWTDDVNTACAFLYRQVGGSPIPYAPNITYDLSAIGGDLAYWPGCVSSPSSLNTTVSCFSQNVSCAELCPLPLYPPSHTRKLEITVGVLSWVFLIFSLLLLLSLSLDAKRRCTFPAYAFIFAIISFSLTLFGFTMTTWVGYKDIQCKYKRLCIAQAVLISFGGIAGACWMVIAFSVLLLRIHLPDVCGSIEQSRLKHLLHIYGWGFPTVFIAIYPSGWSPVYGSVFCNREAIPRDLFKKYLLYPLVAHLAVMAILALTMLAHTLSHIARFGLKATQKSVVRAIATVICFLLPSIVFCIVIFSGLDLLMRDAERAIVLQEVGKYEWVARTMTITSLLTSSLTLIPLAWQRRNFNFLRRFCGGKRKTSSTHSDLALSQSANNHIYSGAGNSEF